MVDKQYSIPVFVSSTFKDMHAERDALRNVVIAKIVQPFAEQYHRRIDLIGTVIQNSFSGLQKEVYSKYPDIPKAQGKLGLSLL